MSQSFSFQNKFSFKAKKPAEEEENNENKFVHKPQKQHPLLQARTEDYVDDTDLYKPRISRQDRVDYFEELLTLKKTRRRSKPVLDLQEIDHYPAAFVWAFAAVRSNRWDHWYLDLLLLWLLLLVAFEDGWVASYAPSLAASNANNALLQLPLALMLVTQVLPLFGTIFFTHFCNDLVQHVASLNFQEWVSECNV